MAKRYYKEDNQEFESKIFPKEETITEEIKPIIEKVEEPVLPAKKNYKTKTKVNVRRAPTGEIIHVYEPGTKVVVEKEENGWSKLDNGLYIRSDLLR